MLTPSARRRGPPRPALSASTLDAVQQDVKAMLRLAHNPNKDSWDVRHTLMRGLAKLLRRLERSERR